MLQPVGTLEKILHILTNLQYFFDKLKTLPLVYWSANFLVALVVAYVSFPILIQRIRSREEWLEYIISTSDLEKKVKRNMRLYTLHYAVVTAFASAALIAIQFKGISLATSIVYGLLGPYILRDKLSGALRRNVTEGLQGQVDESKRILEQEIDSDLSSIDDNLQKELESKLRE
jgi:hypothetical protein